MSLINEEFISLALEFLREVAKAKVDGEKIDNDWYESKFLDENLPKSDIATNAGMNIKTINNIHHSQKKEIVLQASLENYQRMREMVDEIVALCEDDAPIDVSLKIKVGDVIVELTLNETVIVINVLAVKRAAIRGSYWSTAGKRVEKPLMETMCRLFSVPPENFRVESNATEENTSFEREVDFYLVAGDGKEKKCEVKLMGKGNPESADAVIARDSAVFVADKLSDTNKRQLDSQGVTWVELNSDDRFNRFAEMLDKFDIPRAKKPNTGEMAIREVTDKVLKK